LIDATAAKAAHGAASFELSRTKTGRSSSPHAATAGRNSGGKGGDQ